ncbi:MAG: SDR family NAD(P)-dependent oxidoreductase [Chloroflexota bacterium]
MYLPSMQVTDQVALVTGAGSGIGRAIALALAEAGAHVVTTELPEQLARAVLVSDQIRGMGRRSLALPLDVTDVPSIGPFVATVQRELGRLDLLVNNAGVQVARPALDVSEDDWDRVLDVNLRGVFFCAQAAGRVMVAQRHGRIINVASQNGVVGYFNRAAYCAAKAGVVNLTRVLAIEWAPYNVLVNAVAPTFVRTPMGERTLSDPAVRDDILRRIPLGRVAEPEDVVGAVVYLGSPAAAMVTGHTLLVDGGWTAW